jgi:hypothetical protein
VRASDARWWFVGGLVVLLASLIVAGCMDDSPGGGPLGDTSEGGSRFSAPVKRGQFLVVGVITQKNNGGQDAVLEEVEPREPDWARGLEMRYAVVPADNRGCRVGVMRDWPPLGCASRMRPVQGFRVATGGRALILVGARSQELGRWSIPSFRVAYRVGDRNFETAYSQGMGLRVVRDLPWAESSASFSAFRTEAGNIGCAYLHSTRFLRCAIRTGPCYEMKVVGPPRADCAEESVLDPPARVVKARDSWLYDGFRCYVGRASVRCRNQVFEGFFLSGRKSHST